MDFEQLIVLSMKHNASDLHLCSGHYPRLRIDGLLRPFPEYSPVNNSELQALCQQLLNEAQRLKLRQPGQLDFAYTTKNKQRLRGNFFQQQHGLSVAFRLISNHCPQLTALAVPDIIEQLMQQKDGLILITGATGSGKSTTLNAIIGAIHQQGVRHIITLEDPIEYIHEQGAGLIQQRDLGCHTHSACAALNATLRQDPDIILLGELRDTESIRLALTAAETGHLVLATLHTRTAAQSIDRLIDVFPAAEKIAVRGQLAAGLVAVIAQKLVNKQGGGRIALTTGTIGIACRFWILKQHSTCCLKYTHSPSSCLRLPGRENGERVNLMNFELRQGGNQSNPMSVYPILCCRRLPCYLYCLCSSALNQINIPFAFQVTALLSAGARRIT